MAISMHTCSGPSNSWFEMWTLIVSLPLYYCIDCSLKWNELNRAYNKMAAFSLGYKYIKLHYLKTTFSKNMLAKGL